MSKYSTPDSHSRNCPTCIRQRELEIPADHAAHTQGKKKISLPCEKRKISGSKTSLVRRSNSSLSYSDVGSLKKEASFEGTTYLTPTQRKNQEIKRLRLELAKATELLQSKDKAITLLRKEVSAFKDSGEMNESWTAETESVTDSGNCEETWDQDVDGSTSGSGNKLENIDFELMETALREEEETRHKLEEGNEELRDQLQEVRKEMEFTKEQYEGETAEMKRKYDGEILNIKENSNKKVEELVNQLAETSLRCARQQEVIEGKQSRIDEVLTELRICKDKLKNAEENLQTNEETLTKDNTDIDTKHEYLDNTKNALVNTVQDNSSQTESVENITGVTKSTECERSSSENINLPESEIDIVKEESTCDNSIHYTYQFLKRSIYYFLTDKDNSAYHLKSIERLLEFNDTERSVINQTKPVVKKY